MCVHDNLPNLRSLPPCLPAPSCPALLPVRATNPLRPWFTLSRYLIPLNPQLPPWLLTEHDRLWTALVINNSPALRFSGRGRRTPRVLTAACVQPRCASLQRLFTGSVSHTERRTFHLSVTLRSLQHRAGCHCPKSRSHPLGWCCDIRAATWRVLRKTPQLWSDTEEQVEEDRGAAPLSPIWEAAACTRGKRASPLQEQQLMWWASNRDYLLSVHGRTPAPPHGLGGGLCRWRGERRLGGRYGTGTHWPATTDDFHGSITSWNRT